jgi:hypothetical protein
MKYVSLALLCLFGLARAQEAGEKPPDKPGEKAEGAEEGAGKEEAKPEAAPATNIDPQKVLGDLTLCNASKDVAGIDAAAKQVLAWAKGNKDETMAESLAKELGDSLKAAKGNWGTLTVVVQALGELRAKEGAKTLKKLAFQKRVKDEQEEKLQATALVGLGLYADPRDVGGFEEASKSDTLVVAKAAYEAFLGYEHAKAKVRKQCAEVLMKRVEMEYPSSGGQGGKTVSSEKQERWGEVSPIIVKSMQAICGPDTKTINDIDNWREWWKENKKKPWKDEDDKES